MSNKHQWSILALGALLAFSGGKPAYALPGQSTEDVSAWIKAHPTLRPIAGETLLVRKSDTPAQRFIFQASVLPPGRVTFVDDKGLVRTERFTLYDMINGVTVQRLSESLRVIYGATIYQDYERARVVYSYPNLGATGQTVPPAATPLQVALQGELRAGERFGYWLETAQTPRGIAYTGHFVVLLKQDLNKLETELRDRRS